jgi:pyruvate dehydrogenase E2 component (dihydrolipoamide acetyltransferase)
MPERIHMPSLGQTTAELRILSWLKAEGDLVQRGEPLLEVETDKSTLEVEAFTSGTLLKIVRGADEVVEAGALLAYIGAPGEAIPEASTAQRSVLGARCSAGQGTGLTLSGREPRAESRELPSGARVLASPVARHLAKERGVDLALVRGSGPEGRIEKYDVLAFCAMRDQK